MCGRFALHTPATRVAADYFGLELALADDQARYNITPGTRIATFYREGETPVHLVRSWWGFRPAWAKEGAPTPINIRAESAATSPYFRSAFAGRRCLIPVDGWYEWRRTGSVKRPFYFTLQAPEAREVLFLAGLWEPKAGGVDTCCAILTEPAAPEFAFIHDRQPLVLDPEGFQTWLDPEIADRETLRSTVRRLDPKRITARPVSPRVNRPGNDDATLIEEWRDEGTTA